jgi:hypothetical protein
LQNFYSGLVLDDFIIAAFRKAFNQVRNLALKRYEFAVIDISDMGSKQNPDQQIPVSHTELGYQQKKG